MLNLALLKKELMEYLKTSKFIVLIALFAFFAFMSPLLARYINEILGLVSTDINISLPDPTYADAWLQYYKNMSSLCLIVFMIIVTGTVAQEKNKGSIMLVLTKKVSRFQFIIAKFLAAIIIYTILFLVSLIISAAYTYFLFDQFVYSGLALSLVLMWMMGIFYATMAILASVIAKSPTTAALYGFVGYAVFNLLNIATGLQKYNPAGASSLVNSILMGASSNIDNWICLGATFLGIVIAFSVGYMIFRKQEI